MTYITLIRHGQTDWNKKALIQGHIDNPLNETGRSQALLACEKLKKLDRYDIIISSPLLRAFETGRIISQNIGYNIPIIQYDAIIERDFGELEGQLVCQESYKKIFDESAKGLETLKELQSRALKAIKSIDNMYKDKRIIVTTHSHFIKGLISALDPEFDFTFTLENSSLTNVEVNNGKIRLIEYNL